MAGGDGQIDVGAEDARGTDHQVEAPAEAQRRDQGLMRRDPRNTPPQVGQHAGMRIHSHEFNPFAEKRCSKPAGADPQIQNGTLCLAAPVEPGPEVVSFGKRGVEVGEARVGPVRIVPDPVPSQGTRLISLSGT